MQKEVLLGHPRLVHPRQSSSICLTSVDLKNYVVRWTNWRTKTTRTTSLQKKFVCTARNIWWIRSNTVGSDTMSVMHRPDFKQAFVNFATAQTPRSYSSSAKMAKLFLILVELARILVAFFLWASPRRWTQP